MRESVNDKITSQKQAVAKTLPEMDQSKGDRAGTFNNPFVATI